MKKSNIFTAPVIIAAIYFIFGFLWILLSDVLLARFISDLQVYMQVQTFKGWIYVGITTAMIFFLVRFYSQHKDKLMREVEASEKSARSDLKEKEVLLKEVHHRVKNNLQLIQSMIRLNLQQSDSPPAVIEDISRRIYSIALIHEQIYVSDNLARLSFDDYLKRLVDQIFKSVHVPSISVDVQSEPLELELDQIIPCGIIVNEILTNSLKYAFPHGREGNIRIAFRGQSGKKTLKIHDDGIGYTVGRKGSFGLQLVDILSQQLNGSMTLESDSSGTRFSLVF